MTQNVSQPVRDWENKTKNMSAVAQQRRLSSGLEFWNILWLSKAYVNSKKGIKNAFGEQHIYAVWSETRKSIQNI